MKILLENNKNIKSDYLGEGTTQEVDSLGNPLTPEQVKFFSNSKIRDRHGRLLVCIHCTNNEFDAFDKSFIGTSNGMDYGSGFYFSGSELDFYGSKKMSCYLNIENPFTLDLWTDSGREEFFSLLSGCGYDEDIDYYRDDAQRIVDNHGSAEFLDMIIGPKELTDICIKKGYDGMIIGDVEENEVIAFEPNQIKSITNTNPTNSNKLTEGVNTQDEFKIFEKRCVECANIIVKQIEKSLDKYGFEVELLTDHKNCDDSCVGMFLVSEQDCSTEFPIVLNVRGLYNAVCENELYDSSELIGAIKMTLWHEVGHGIVSYLSDVYDFDWDEEEVVEEFARIVCDTNKLEGELIDVLNEFESEYGDNNINEDLTLYRVGDVDRGTFFTDDLGYYSQSLTGYKKEDTKTYTIDLSRAKVFDPIKELNLYPNTWSDIEGKVVDFEKYNIDYESDSPDAIWGHTSTDDIVYAVKDSGYDVVILRDIPGDYGYGDPFNEYVVFNTDLLKPVNNINEELLSESLHNLGSDCFITDSPYTMRDILVNKPKAYRILYDMNIDSYMFGDASDVIHWDLIQVAHKQGYYADIEKNPYIDPMVLEYIKDGDLNNYVDLGNDGYYWDDNDEYIEFGQYLLYGIWIPKGTYEDDVANSPSSDGYDDDIKCNVGTLFMRGASQELLDNCDLIKLLQKQSWSSVNESISHQDEKAVREFALECKEDELPFMNYKEFAELLSEQGMTPNEELYQVYTDEYKNMSVGYEGDSAIADKIIDEFLKLSTEQIVQLVNIPNRTQIDTASPMFILPNGTIVSVKEVGENLGYDSSWIHGDLMHVILDTLANKLGLYYPTEMEDAENALLEHLTYELGWARINCGTTWTEDRFYCVLPTTMTNGQFRSLEKWLEWGYDNHKGDDEVLICFEHTNRVYEFKEYFPEDIMKIVKRYFSSGNLYENYLTEGLINIDVNEAEQIATQYVSPTPTYQSWIDNKGRFIDASKLGSHYNLVDDIFWQLSDRGKYQNIKPYELSGSEYNQMTDDILDSFAPIGWIQIGLDCEWVGIFRKPNSSQYQSLEEYLDYAAHQGVSNFSVNVTSGSDFANSTYDLKEVTPEYIISRIKRYFASGRLYENRKEMKENMNTSIKPGDRIKMDYYAKPNNGATGTCKGRVGQLCSIEWDDGSKSKEITTYLTKIDNVNEDFVNELVPGELYHFIHNNKILYGTFKRKTPAWLFFDVDGREVLAKPWTNVATTTEELEELMGLVDKMEKDTKIPSQVPNRFTRVPNQHGKPMGESINEGLWAYQTWTRTGDRNKPINTLTYGQNIVAKRDNNDHSFTLGADWERHIDKLIEWLNEYYPGFFVEKESHDSASYRRFVPTKEQAISYIKNEIRMGRALTESNELKQRAKKHKKKSKGMGWHMAVNAGDVEKGIDVFNNSVSSTPSTGEGTAMGEDVNKSSEECVYHYDGPIYYRGHKIAATSDIWTTAKSINVAIRNVLYKAANGDKDLFHYDIVDSMVKQVEKSKLPKFRPTCKTCGYELNDIGDCPVCDYGEEDLLESLTSLEALWELSNLE